MELDQLRPFLRGYRLLIEQELARSIDAVDRIWFMYLDSYATRGKSLTPFIRTEPEPVARLFAYLLLIDDDECRPGYEWDEVELFETVKSCLFSRYGWLRWRALILWAKTRACLDTPEGLKLLDWVLENDPSDNCRHAARLITK